jgi:pimeloyl-ACP methyl ester carboxylesterase
VNNQALMQFPYDQAAPPDIQDETPPENRAGVALRNISFSNGLRGRVAAYLVTPPAVIKPPYAGIMWVHWLEGGDSSSNRTEFLDEAIELGKEGVVSLLPDGFWSTDPKRWASRTGFWWTSEAKHDIEMSVRQVVELRRALDLLLAQPGVDPGRIAYVAHDFGAMFGTIIAAVDRRPQYYVMMAATTTFSEWFLFGSKLTGPQEQAYIKELSSLDPIRYVSHTTPAKLYFQFAHADYYVPERTAQMLYDAASEPKEVTWYDAGHDVKHDQARPDRMGWIRKQLKSSTSNENKRLL